jgi:hypothetical protein
LRIYCPYDSETQVGTISFVFAEEGTFNGEAPQPGHILHAGSSETARARSAVLQETLEPENIEETVMPDEGTTSKAKQDLREGKSPSTAAGEFVHEEIEHVREGKHGARSPQQAIAIGLSKARRAGIPLKPPAKGKTSASTRQKAERDYEKGQKSPQTSKEGSTKRSRSRMEAMKREPQSPVSHSALSRQAKSAARRRKSSGA